MVRDRIAGYVRIRVRVAERPRQVALRPVVLAIDQVAHSTDRHSERKAGGHRVQVARSSRDGAQVEQGRGDAEDDRAVEGEALGADPAARMDQSAGLVLDQVQNPRAHDAREHRDGDEVDEHVRVQPLLTGKAGAEPASRDDPHRDHQAMPRERERAQADLGIDPDRDYCQVGHQECLRQSVGKEDPWG